MSRHFPERNLNHTAVYWSAPTNDGYGGFSYGQPVELECRWEEAAKLFNNREGQEIIGAIAVQVTVDVEQNGMMKLGTLDDLESADYNDPVGAGALPVVRFDKVPTV